MKSLLSLAFILSFFLMVINGVIYFMTEHHLANLLGLILFGTTSFLLLWISEKKFGEYTSFSTLSSKLFLAIIGGVTLSGLMLFLSSKIGLPLSLALFLGGIFLVYILKGLLGKEKEQA